MKKLRKVFWGRVSDFKEIEIEGELIVLQFPASYVGTQDWILILDVVEEE